MALLTSLGKPNHYLSLSSISILCRNTKPIQAFNHLRYYSNSALLNKVPTQPGSSFHSNKATNAQVLTHSPFVLNSTLSKNKLLLNYYSNVRFLSTTPPVSTVVAEVKEIATSIASSPDTVADVVTTVASTPDVATAVEPGFLSKLVSPIFESFHAFTGLPWWVSIISVTFLVRLALFYPFVNTTRNGVKMAKATPEINELKQKYEGDPMATSKMMKETGEIYKTHGLNPMKMMLGSFAQIPVFLGIMYSLDDLPKMLPEMKTGGILWFTDLSMPDTFFILPTITALMFLPTIQMAFKRNPTNSFMSKPAVLWALRILVLSAVPFSAYFPASVTLYWAANSVFTFIQQYLLGFDKVRLFFNIPVLSKNTAKPDILVLPKRGAVNTEQLAEVNKRYNPPTPQQQPTFHQTLSTNQQKQQPLQQQQIQQQQQQQDDVKKERRRRR
eukprot:TRINITY_DN746_c0_g1_i1.p1 TRINITY_DN746_c0_g1~~TRINITY_DN746_c0_g1_i1.p1  ORF type:complete len:443 (+),score=82.64 TRINITY_DN746_c0_g1_i1:114-1442(+)